MLKTILLEAFQTDNLLGFPDHRPGVHLFAAPKPDICYDERALEIQWARLPEIEDLDASYRAAGKEDDLTYLQARANTLDAIYHNREVRGLYILSESAAASEKTFEYMDRIASALLSKYGVVPQGQAERYYLRQVLSPGKMGFVDSNCDPAEHEVICDTVRGVISLSKHFAAVADCFYQETFPKSAFALNESFANVLPRMFGLPSGVVGCTKDNGHKLFLDIPGDRRFVEIYPADPRAPFGKYHMDIVSESKKINEEFSFLAFSNLVMKPLYEYAVAKHGAARTQQILENHLESLVLCRPAQLPYRDFIKDFIPGL